MKRIIGAAMAVILGVFMTGCGSTGSAANTASAKQAKDLGLPAWTGGSYTSEEIVDVWDGPVKEKGLFFPGESNFGDRNTATSTAELNAKANVAQYVQQAIIDAQAKSTSVDPDKKISNTFARETGTAVARKVSGIRRVDRFIDGDYVYVLMFVSNANIQKALKDESLSDYELRFIETVFPTEPKTQPAAE
ncbi:MAG: hypothetical protein IJJ71_05180 [Treponema sp.]|uniref:LptM family lipoprotein n=1 Tax=Treponema sp. TaxID=166 RepID=UPI0025F366F9|nr:hypothetical protein [Treponema sp.]MBR0495549.1 hypothetical protein [Treponema sp.]